MKTKSILKFTMGALFGALVGLAISVHGFSSSISDDKVYNEMGTITGKVTILNHPELGVTPDSGAYLVFQREGCKLCLVATHADAEGNYSITVGRGRYKIINYNPSPPTYDRLAPEQPRYVAVANGIKDTVFNIKVVLPKDK